MNKSTVCRIANHFTAAGYPRAMAFRMSWKLVKAAAVVKVTGVTFGRRQAAIAHLCRYDAGQISFELTPEPMNGSDPRSVAVLATVAGKGSYKVGYLPRSAARAVSQIINKGVGIKASKWEIVGGSGYIFGLRLGLAA